MELYLAEGTDICVAASTTRCRLYHTGALTEQLVLAINDSLGFAPRVRKASEIEDDSDEPSGPPVQRLIFRGDNDHFTVSLDTSGELLHKRGWRTEQGAAPMRETLAAGLLALADYDPALPLIDPMCGAGTIAIEAAQLARAIPAGAQRKFAYTLWPIGPSLESSAAAKPDNSSDAAPVPTILAADADPAMCTLARNNAAHAGVGENLRVVHASLENLAPADIAPGPGLVLVNPPYGKRLRPGQNASSRALARNLRARFPEKRIAVITTDTQFEQSMRLTPTLKTRVTNGGLPTTFYVFNPA